MKVIHLQGQKTLRREDRPRTLSPFGESHPIPVGDAGPPEPASHRDTIRYIEAVRTPGAAFSKPGPRPRPARTLLAEGRAGAG